MYLFSILIFKCTLMGFRTQIGCWPGNCHLIDCSISFRQLYSPVRSLLSLVCGPFSCGNLCTTGVSIQCSYGFSEGNRQHALAWTGNKTINQNSLCRNASNCDPWLQSEGGEGWRGVEWGNPDCIITFFHLLQHVLGVLGWNCCFYFWK